ncbi:hypothetical protein MMC13_005858 [Lambiella insularis]|nr:hypothetical protein [Lambiella insularis]
MTERTRLYISPLNSELTGTIIPSTLVPSVSSISYHSLQTFPERNYGYIELPVMEAMKLKKKLNGSILKGSKVRVEEARPAKKLKRSAEDDDGEHEADKKIKRAGKKSKREEGVLSGYELPQERKVKRGWTEAAAESKKDTVKNSSKDRKTKRDKPAKATPSSFSKEPECLFRTRLPPNKVTNAPKSTTKEQKPKRLKGGTSEREAVVHEFSNTTKHPTFLRDSNDNSSGKIAVEYVDGKGWVNKDGKIVEEAPKLDTRRKKTRATGGGEDPNPRPLPLRNGDAKEHETSSIINGALRAPNSDDTSSSGTSTSSASDSGSEEVESGGRTDDADIQNVQSSHLKTSSVGKDQRPIDTRKDSDATSSSGDSHSSPSSEEDEISSLKASSTEASTDIHPLEALFKRPKPSASDTLRKPQLEVKTSFSFFDSENTNASQTHHLMPQTPFTQRDLHHRSIRSAAPTPDTAAPNKSGFGNLWEQNDDVESDEDEEPTEAAGPLGDTPLAGQDQSAEQATGEKPPESDFVKWFWEHRGETNRAWKKRLREAKKEKRQKENKRRTRTAV